MTNTKAQPNARLIGLIVVVMLVSTSLIGNEETEEPVTKTSGVEEAESKISLEEILAENPNNRDYVDRNLCISTRAIRSQEVLSSRHILFKLRGKDKPTYLVHFGKTCWGLERNATVATESLGGGSRLCAGDYVRTETFEFGQQTWGPRCSIPGFQKVTEYQVELLKEALLSGRVE